MFLEALLGAGGEGSQIEEGDFTVTVSYNAPIPVEMGDPDAVICVAQQDASGGYLAQASVKVRQTVYSGYSSPNGFSPLQSDGRFMLSPNNNGGSVARGTWHYMAIKWS